MNNVFVWLMAGNTEWSEFSNSL